MLDTVYSLSGDVPAMAPPDDPGAFFQPGALVLGSVRQICQIRKLGSGGAVLHVDVPVEPEARLELELEDGETLEGVVAWRQGSEIGLKFDRAIDIGAMYRPASWLRFGVVAKDINAPTFDAPNGAQFKLDPQVRAGMAVNPYRSLTLSADVDLTSNKTLTPGVKSQYLSLCAEQTILSELLSFRVGAFKNMQDAQTPFIPTAGFGLRLLALRIDIGGGYDFRDQAAIASGSIGMTF